LVDPFYGGKTTYILKQLRSLEEVKKDQPVAEGEPETEAEDDVVEFVFTDDGEEDLRATLKKFRKELKEARAEKMDYLTKLQRERADFQNYKKDESARLAQIGSYAREKMVEDLLPVLDAYDMAFANKEAWEKVDKNWRMGVEYIHQQLMKVLSENGVSEIPVQSGDVFDPKLHEPFGNTETDDAALEHKIEKVIQIGYKAGEKIIRPARVAVWVGK
jgi:molecular chaperone GrpE